MGGPGLRVSKWAQLQPFTREEFRARLVLKTRRSADNIQTWKPRRDRVPHGAQCLLRRTLRLSHASPGPGISCNTDSFSLRRWTRFPTLQPPLLPYAPGCRRSLNSQGLAAHLQGPVVRAFWRRSLTDAHLLPFLTDSPLELDPDTSFSPIPPGSWPDTGSLRPGQAAPDSRLSLPQCLEPVLQRRPTEPERLLYRAVS